MRGRTRRAFSLIELVLVLSIIGIVAAIAAPRYSRALERYRVNAAADRLVADLTVARERAGARSMPQTVRFIALGQIKRYQLETMADPDDPAETYTVDFEREPYRLTEFTAKLGGASALTFSGFGIPDRPAEFELRAGNFVRIVIVNSATGEVTLQ